MKIQRGHFLGARASARFNGAIYEPQVVPDALRFCEVKRRERRAPSEGGSISLIFIVLLAIMMILVTAEVRALHHLHREVKFLEQQQIKRLGAPPTNAVATVSPLKP